MDASDSITMGEKERAPRKLSGSPAAGFDDVPPHAAKKDEAPGAYSHAGSSGLGACDRKDAAELGAL